MRVHVSSVARLRDKRDGYAHRDDDVVSFPAVSLRECGVKSVPI